MDRELHKQTTKLLVTGTKILNENFEHLIQSILDDLDEILFAGPNKISAKEYAEQKWIGIEIASALSQILDSMPQEFTRLLTLSQDSRFLEKYALLKKENPIFWFKEKEKVRRLICENRYPLNDLTAIWGRLLILLNFKKIVSKGIDLQIKPSPISTKAPSPFVYSMI